MGPHSLHFCPLADEVCKLGTLTLLKQAVAGITSHADVVILIGLIRVVADPLSFRPIGLDSRSTPTQN